jgi:hypothetical protein
VAVGWRDREAITTVMPTHRLVISAVHAVEPATGANLAAMANADQPTEVIHGLA